MLDDRDKKLDALFAAARREPVDTSGRQEHFETRLMAKLAERKTAGAPWHLMVWRMIPTFALITAMMLFFSFTVKSVVSSDPFAAIMSGHEDLVAGNYLGE